MTPPGLRRPEPAEVVRRLRERPGRGGVRLTYREAEVALELLAAGCRALARERGLLAAPAELSAHELVGRDDELELVDGVGAALAVLRDPGAPT